MQTTIKLLGCWVLSLQLTTVYAFEAPPPADIRCLIIGSRLGASTDANQRTAGNMLAIYYVGRLDQFSPKAIEDAMFNEAVAITPSELQSETARCGRVLIEKGQLMTQIGNDLVRRGKEMMDKQPPPPASAPSSAPPSEQKNSNDK